MAPKIGVDYHPFGMTMGGRSWSQSDYRYGFQGQEQDKELYGGAVSYKYRVHDPRIGRFLSIDPLAPEYPWNSPYAFSENKVIHAVELEGLEAQVKYFVLPVNATRFGLDHYWGRNRLKEQGRLIEEETVNWSTLNPGEEHGPYGTGTMLIFQRKSRPYSDDGEYDKRFFVYEKSSGDVYNIFRDWEPKDFPGIVVWGSGTGGKAIGRDGSVIGTFDFAKFQEIMEIMLVVANQRDRAPKLKQSVSRPGLEKALGKNIGITLNSNDDGTTSGSNTQDENGTWEQVGVIRKYQNLQSVLEKENGVFYDWHYEGEEVVDTVFENTKTGERDTVPGEPQKTKVAPQNVIKKNE